jgi:O-antigen ligase
VLTVGGVLTKRRTIAAGLLLIGAVGLLQAESIAAIAAAGLVLAAFAVRPAADVSQARRQALVSPARAIILVTGCFALIVFVRPENLPSSETFASSSTTHRLILGEAGLYEFVNHPILGVGWQRSSAPEVIGDPELSERLREKYEDSPPGFFPDETANTVHNAYIQMLAEAGLVGAIAVVALFLTARIRIRRLFGALTPEHALSARLALLTLVMVLIWWNDNPLFGALLPAAASRLPTAALGVRRRQRRPRPPMPTRNGLPAPGPGAWRRTP